MMKSKYVRDGAYGQYAVVISDKDMIVAVFEHTVRQSITLTGSAVIETVPMRK